MHRELLMSQDLYVHVYAFSAAAVYVFGFLLALGWLVGLSVYMFIACCCCGFSSCLFYFGTQPAVWINEYNPVPFEWCGVVGWSSHASAVLVAG